MATPPPPKPNLLLIVWSVIVILFAVATGMFGDYVNAVSLADPKSLGSFHLAVREFNSEHPWMAYALPVLLVGAVIVAVCYAGVLRYYDAAMHSKFYFDETRSVRAFKFLAGHTRIVDGRRVSAAFVVRSMCDALAIGSSAWKVSKAFAKRNQLEWTEAGCAQPIYELLNVCKSAGLLAHTAQIDDNAAVEGYKFTKFGTKVVPFCEDAAPPTLVAEQSN